jgi:glycosyltransferase involved in cell wall biosynthesis
MNEIIFLMPAWRTPGILKYSIPSLARSLTTDSKIVVVLNESDNVSKDICENNGVIHIELNSNFGPASVDFAIEHLDSKYVCNVNSDMLFHHGWDQTLIDELEEYYPCSASSTLVESYGGGHNLWLFDHTLGHISEQAAGQFELNVRQGKYKTYRKSSFNHPILCRTEDYKNVGYYSHCFETEWHDTYGKGLDVYFAYRLWKLHDEKFRFVMSPNAFTYHDVSRTMKLVPPQLIKPSGHIFQKRTGMTQLEFHETINYGDPI